MELDSSTLIAYLDGSEQVSPVAPAWLRNWCVPGVIRPLCRWSR